MILSHLRPPNISFCYHIQALSKPTRLLLITAAGLERVFRLLQSIVQIVLSYPILVSTLLYVINLGEIELAQSLAMQSILSTLYQRLGLARRFLRLFRFLDSFFAAQQLYLSIPLSNQANKTQPPWWLAGVVWLDFFGRTFNGLYLLLETSTIVDVLRIPGLQLYGPVWERIVNIEAQRFWLFALVCGVLSGLLQLLKLFAHVPVSKMGHESSKGEGIERTPGLDEKTSGGVHTFDREEELMRLRHVFKARKEERALWLSYARKELYRLSRNILANAHDIVLPGVVVGWLYASPGVLGIVTLFTTVLTSVDIWERCGKNSR